MGFCIYTMMKKYIRIIRWTASLLLAATGCVQPVEIEPPAEREVFVKCILEKGRYEQRVILLYSGGIGDDQFQPVTNASVIVNGPTSMYPHPKDYAFHPVSDGIYEGGVEPIDGGVYTLKVVVPGRDTLVATTTMPGRLFFKTQIIGPLQAHFEPFEPSNPVWDYHWLGGILEYRESYEIMKEMGGTCMESEMPGLRFRLESEEHHHIYVLGRIEDSTGVVAPIRQLATNHLLVDNINTNGRQYRASATSLYTDNPKLIEYEYLIKQHYDGLTLHDGYLRIDYPENYDNGLRNIHNLWGSELHEANIIYPTRDFVVVGDFEYNYWGVLDRETPHPVLHFCSVSEEYDRYLRSVQASLADAEGDLLSTLYGEAGGYSNVQGGCGVFGAVSSLRYDCDVQYRSYNEYQDVGSYPPYTALLPEL